MKVKDIPWVVVIIIVVIVQGIRIQFGACYDLLGPLGNINKYLRKLLITTTK